MSEQVENLRVKWEQVRADLKRQDQELLDLSSNEPREGENSEVVEKRQGAFLEKVLQYAVSEEKSKLNEYFPGPKVFGEARKLLREERFARILNQASSEESISESSIDAVFDTLESYATTRRLTVGFNELVEKGEVEASLGVGLLALASKGMTRGQQRDLISKSANQLIQNIFS